MSTATGGVVMDPQQAFQKLKAVCVPLLPLSDIKQSNIPLTSKALSDLIDTLNFVRESGGPGIINASLASYTFFPISTILRRNALSSIPSQVLVKVLTVLNIICDAWWWDCELTIWEQCFMLCGAIVGDMEGKGKGKTRDDETKEAAARCLWTLARERTRDESIARRPTHPEYHRTRLSEICAHARSEKMVPIIGQTLNALLATAESKHQPLQLLSLQVLEALIRFYAPAYLLPSILPGVVSSTSKVALGISSNKGWANGDVVDRALAVMQHIIVQSISDDICIKEGAIQQHDSLESLSSPLHASQESQPTSSSKPYATSRTASWLRGTSSQLHVALNNLTPLVSHSNPTALIALSRFSAAILTATPLALPQTQPLLLSFLLSLSNSSFPSVSSDAFSALTRLLKPSSKARTSLLQTIINTTRDNLSALPRLIPTHADAKVEHLASLIYSVCRLVMESEASKPSSLSPMTAGLAKLLGPTGGIEKWGWSLLSVLELKNPAITISQPASLDRLIENEQAVQWAFPEVGMKYVTTTSAQLSLAKMFRALGKAAGEGCLFSVEWFTNLAHNQRGPRGVTALWCACRLLEGLGGVDIYSLAEDDSIGSKRSPRLEKFARVLAKSVAELWDDVDALEGFQDPPSKTQEEEDSRHAVEYVKGLAIKANLNIGSESSKKPLSSTPQPILHQSLSLQLLSITSGILQSRFPPLLLHTIYPVLRSIMSDDSFLSTTALASLNFITTQTSYASPANLLLSNFDYALNSISRRLNRRWLDLEAAKVLALLVRLVGKDVVDRAGDVVEECFDRLDDYHGYDLIVEGLIEVLNEVIKVIEIDEEPLIREDEIKKLEPTDVETFDLFCHWFKNRPDEPEKDTTDYGPAPKEAWGPGKKRYEKGENDDEDENHPVEGDNTETKPDPSGEAATTPTQALTKQIISRSLYFLTHGSPSIRARILSLLSSAVPVLPESALLPSVHRAWPFILNRLADPEPFVISAAASLVESLTTHVGSFMSRRVWDDIWPRFRAMLAKLDAADSSSALARRGLGAVGTESAYTHSHRLYRALLRTMTAAVSGGMKISDGPVWEVTLAFRRFLHVHAHEELQACARELYVAIGRNNADAVWLALVSTVGEESLQGEDGSEEKMRMVAFLRDPLRDIKRNVDIILSSIPS